MEWQLWIQLAFVAAPAGAMALQTLAGQSICAAGAAEQEIQTMQRTIAWTVQAFQTETHRLTTVVCAEAIAKWTSALCVMETTTVLTAQEHHMAMHSMTDAANVMATARPVQLSLPSKGRRRAHRPILMRLSHLAHRLHLFNRHKRARQLLPELQMPRKLYSGCVSMLQCRPMTRLLQGPGQACAVSLLLLQASRAAESHLVM
jgi:hypothetical protein